MPRTETLGLSESTPRFGESAKEPLLAFHSNSYGCRLSRYTRLLGLYCNRGSVVCFLSIQRPTNQRFSHFTLLLSWRGRGAGTQSLCGCGCPAYVCRRHVLQWNRCGSDHHRSIVAVEHESHLDCVSGKPDSQEAALPPRLNETMTDKFADRLPQWLWPKLRIPYYVFSAIFVLLVFAGLALMQTHTTVGQR